MTYFPEPSVRPRLGSESVTITTDLNVIFVDVGSKAWDRTALVTTTAAKILTLQTSAIANGGDWTGGGRSLAISNASIIAEHARHRRQAPPSTRDRT